MAELVLEAGDGDHLEIGVLHGGTLIMAALVKREYGLQGKVVGLDPLDGFYPAGPMNPDGVYNDKGTQLITRPDDKGVPVSLENLMDNVRHFGIADRIEIIQKFSYPFPEEIAGRFFASCYIDGDHYRDGPLHDWELAWPRVKRLIWFDDCNENCPAVKRVRPIARKTSGWHEKELFGNQILVMERNAG